MSLGLGEELVDDHAEPESENRSEWRSPVPLELRLGGNVLKDH
jgi:hypothetical protein